MSKKSKTSTFLLELPLQITAHQAKHLRAHFEAARCLYNALLGEAVKRLKLMRADPRWQQACNIPKTEKQERIALFSHLRQEYGFSDQKSKYQVGCASVGLDLGPSTIAIVPEVGEARLLSFCSDLKADKRKKRRLERKLDRQRRAKKGRLRWKDSRGYKATRRRLSSQDRKLAAHRKGLHGRLVHEVVACGNTIKTEKLSYKAWVCPVPERVCLKVLPATIKSYAIAMIV